MKPEHMKDGKVKDEHKSKYSARQVRDAEEDLDAMNEKDLLVLILNELRRRQ